VSPSQGFGVFYQTVLLAAGDCVVQWAIPSAQRWVIILRVNQLLQSRADPEDLTRASGLTLARGATRSKQATCLR